MDIIEAAQPIKLITFTGASGAGKTTIVKELLDQRQGFELLESLTTREKRPSDLPNEYRYITEAQFEKYNKKGEFIWTFEIYDQKVGTLTSSIRQALHSNYGIIYLMILTQEGIRMLRKIISYEYLAGILSFYVFSPAEQVLRRRLMKRGDNDASINRRISDCKIWDKEASNSGIPYTFIDNSGTLSDTMRQINQYLPIPPKTK